MNASIKFAYILNVMLQATAWSLTIIGSYALHVRSSRKIIVIRCCQELSAVAVGFYQNAAATLKAHPALLVSLRIHESTQHSTAPRATTLTALNTGAAKTTEQPCGQLVLCQTTHNPGITVHPEGKEITTSAQELT